MRWARPSTIAVLPTPGSPIRTGLFLVRRERTWMTRRISSSRPMTGSSLPSSAACVRSRPNFSSDWYLSSGFWSVTRCGPRTASIAGDDVLLARAVAAQRVAGGRTCGRRGRAAGARWRRTRRLNWPSSRSAARRTATSSRLTVGLVGGALDGREPVEGGVDVLADGLRAGAELAQDGHDDAVLLLEQDGEQVLGRGLGVVARGGERAGGLQRGAGTWS